MSRPVPISGWEPHLVCGLLLIVVNAWDQLEGVGDDEDLRNVRMDLVLQQLCDK